MTRRELLDSLLVASTMFVAGCQESDPKIQESDPKIFIVDANPLPGEAGRGRWRPGMGEAAIAKAALRDYLTNNTTVPPGGDPYALQNQAAVLAAFDRYVLQMQGVRAATATSRGAYDTDGVGPKQIHIDGIHRLLMPSMPTLNSEQVLIADGGNFVFQAIYDLNSRSTVQFTPGGN